MTTREQQQQAEADAAELARFEAVVGRTRAMYEALPSEDDIPNTRKARSDLWERSNVLRGRYRDSRSAVVELERWTRERRAVTDSLAILTEIRAVLVERLLALPSDKTDRSKEQEQQVIGLTRAIQQIDRGVEYMDGAPRTSNLLDAELRARLTPTWDGSRFAWDYLYGSLPETERYLAEVERRIDAARAKLTRIEQSLAAEEVATVASN